MTAAFYHACPDLTAGRPCRCFSAAPWSWAGTTAVGVAGAADERRLCDCGLVATGRAASWALAHADGCDAAPLFRGREGYL